MEKDVEHEWPSDTRPPLEEKSYPCLVICHGKHKEKQTFYNLSQNHYSTKAIPEMCNKFIHTFSCGWLMLKDFDSNDCFLLNLKSWEKIQLPPIESNPCYMCGLSSSPDDPNCHLLLASLDNMFAYCKLGDECFKVGVIYPDQQLQSLTISEGKFYGIASIERSSYLVALEFDGFELLFTPLIKIPKLMSPSSFGARVSSYMVEFSGEIFYIRKFYAGLNDYPKKVSHFWIIKTDSSHKKWFNVESIGGFTIFLNDSGASFCCSSSEYGSKKNSIYFLESEDRNFYLYNLEDKSVSMHLPCPNTRKHSSLLTWVNMPSAGSFR